MTFGPGSTYGEDGAAAAGAYYVVTWIGIVVMVAVLVYWVYWENRRLHELRREGRPPEWMNDPTAARSSSRRCRRTPRRSRP